EEYGGMGADALAVSIIIEEVARGCASSSLIPAVNKLGSMPVQLGGSDEIKQKYFPSVAAGEAGFSYGLSEREAGSDTASMKTRAVRDGDDWILNGVKTWITNAGESEYYTVMAVTDPDGARGRNISAFVVEKSDEGFTFGEKERKLGIKGSPTRELLFDNVRLPGDRIVGEPQQFAKAVAENQGIQFMLADMGMKLEAARQLTYTAAAKSQRFDDDLTYFGAAAKAYASDAAMEITTDAVQLLGGAGYVVD